MAIDISFLQSEHTLIPFIFVLAIVFGVLELTRVFRNRAVNFLVALAISFFTITNSSFVEFLWLQFGNITAFFIIMFFITFVLEVFGLRGNKQPRSKEEGMILMAAILLLLLSFGFMYSNLLPPLPFIGGGTNVIILFAIIFILIIFWMAFKLGPEQVKSEGPKKE